MMSTEQETARCAKLVAEVLAELEAAKADPVVQGRIRRLLNEIQNGQQVEKFLDYKVSRGKSGGLA